MARHRRVRPRRGSWPPACLPRAFHSGFILETVAEHVNRRRQRAAYWYIRYDPYMIEDVRAGLRSVVAVAVTPFDSGDRIDEAAYAAAVERLVRGGITAITPNGNTGEFYALSDEELGLAVRLTRD